ncbi:MAG: 30S ribosomal protein S8, partial [Actinobacteria bacterium]|nr:30S ribosomal protein S8 [Actinomycetota bacterium]
MLTRIRNGVAARHQSVTMPASRLKAEVARILKSEGFIAGFEVQSGQLVLRLRYLGGKVPAVAGLRRISRPGLRVYARNT